VSQLNDLQQKLAKAQGAVSSTRAIPPTSKDKEGKDKEEKKKEENQLAKSVKDRCIIVLRLATPSCSFAMVPVPKLPLKPNMVLLHRS
jgi:hypothetical protein